MSKIDREAAAIMYDDMGKPVQFKGHMEDGIYIPSPEEEAEIQAEARLYELTQYTTDELEAELDSRVAASSDVRERK